MGCCGKGGPPKASTKSSARSLPDGDAPEGMTLVEYTGGNVGKTPYYGPTTHTRYVVSTGAPIIYVDDRDLAAVLDMTDGGRTMFRLYQPPAGAEARTLDESQKEDQQADAVAVDEASELEVADEQQAEEEVAAESLVTTSARVFDPTDATVAEIEQWATTASAEELARAFAAEQAGKARKGAIAALQGALDALA